ncbi:hypothetical protein BS17DRAFT_811740 [Gyrodon lividus]|nr:hypothetical protein BS17DRAFT_811740 [Gyrodon lividus]
MPLAHFTQCHTGTLLQVESSEYVLRTRSEAPAVSLGSHEIRALQRSCDLPLQDIRRIGCLLQFVVLFGRFKPIWGVRESKLHELYEGWLTQGDSNSLPIRSKAGGQHVPVHPRSPSVPCNSSINYKLHPAAPRPQASRDGDEHTSCEPC